MNFYPERHARRLGIAGWFLAVGGAVVGGWVGVPLAVIGIGLLLLGCVSAKDGFLLLGPIAAADARRYARRGRPWLWRMVYAAVMVVILLFHLNSVAGDTLPRQWVTAVNERIADWFAVCLFLSVAATAVLTFSGGVPDDRAAKRWDVLRTTDLRPREIVFGKLAGQAPALLEPLLTATPVLAVLPMFGGVSPWFPAAVLGCCAAVGFGLGGIALFYSVFAKSGRQAVGWTVLLVVVYLFGSGILSSVAARLAKAGPVAPAANAAVAAVAAGNPFVAWAEMKGPSEAMMVEAAGRFITFQFAAGLLFALVACRRLPRAEPWDFDKPKPVLSSQLTLRQVRPQVFVLLPKPKPTEPVRRPDMGDLPIVWWERYGWLNKGQRQFVESLNPYALAGIAICTGLFGVAISTGGLVSPGATDRPRTALHAIVATIAILVLAFGGVVFGVVPFFRAARCVARERTANTLESLLTAFSPREVLYQKWRGVLLSEWPALSFLLCAVGPLLLTAVIHPGAGVLYFLALVVQSAALVAVGVAVSTRVRTPAQGTAVAVVGFAAVAFAVGTAVSSIRYPLNLYAYAVVVPPVGGLNLLTDAVNTDPGFRPPSAPQRFPVLAASLVGTLGWAAVAWAAWRYAVYRLNRERA